jgi:hypothetical protein
VQLNETVGAIHAQLEYQKELTQRSAAVADGKSGASTLGLQTTELARFKGDVARLEVGRHSRRGGGGVVVA